MAAKSMRRPVRAGGASRIVRLAAVNLGVFVAALLAVLTILSVAGDAVRVVKNAWPKPVDGRALLPNYPDPALARQIYADQDRVVQEYVPFLGWRAGPLTTSTLHIDADGFRVRAADRRDGRGRTAIGFFGGSTMWGKGVDDDSTIPAVFGELTSKYDVRNFGQVGWTSRQSLEQLVNLLNQGEAPRLVVFYEGYNDVWVLCNRAVTQRLDAHHEEPRMRELLAKRPTGSRLYATLIQPIVDAVKGLVGPERIPDDFACSRDPALAGAVAETLVRNWEMARRLVAGYGGELFAFLQPCVFVGSPRTDHMANLQQIARAVDSHFDDQIRAVYPLIQAKLAARASGWGSDLTHAFDGTEPIYVDTAHVTRNGNAIIAKLIQARIDAAGQDGGSGG